MVKHYFILFTICLNFAFTTVTAQDTPVLTLSVPSQNNLKYNRFIQNPTFSFVREDNTTISMYHRNQWIQYNDSPKAYMLSYTGKFNEKSGLGIGLYQQSLGVISSFGGIANYARNVRLGSKMNLTLGFNLAYYSSGVNTNKTITAQDDPLLYAYRNTSLLTIKPGINLSYGNFDIGAYADNMIDYDFKTSKMANDFIDKTYTGHLMYTHNFVAGVGAFTNSNLRLMLRGRMSESFGFGLGGGVMVDFPRMGWIQTEVDPYYGVGAGMGFYLTKRLAIGYTYEQTIKEGLVNLGPTHELNIAFAIKERKGVKRDIPVVAENQQNQSSENQSENTDESKNEDQTESQEDLAYNGDSSMPNDTPSMSEAERKQAVSELQSQLDEQNQYLLDMLLKEDSLTGLKKSELEKKIKNLQEYAQREKNFNTENGNIKTMIIKNENPSAPPIEPKSIDDLKYAKGGYYLVSRPANGNDNGMYNLKYFNQLPDAVRAYHVKLKAGTEKELYIIQVESNAPTSQSVAFYNQPSNNNTDTSSSESSENRVFDNSYGTNSNTQNMSKSRAGNSTNRLAQTTTANNSNETSRTNGGANSQEKQSNNKETNRLLAQNDSNKSTSKINGSDETIASENSSVSKENGTNKKIASNSSIKVSNTKTSESKKNTTPNTKSNDNNNKTSVASGDKKTVPEKRNAPKGSVSMNIDGVDPGYYIVANVFSEFPNAEYFVVTLNKKGIDANFFANPKNNYMYVYLKRFDTWNEALDSYHSNVNNTYYGNIWIMSINEKLLYGY